ncbi:MAG TPA: hypothetical protein PLK77_14115 [Pyrinomonadaceae bacterium]|nr:hypothetical protein [Pyrinomonadaceae bacterium]
MNDEITKETHDSVFIEDRRKAELEAPAKQPDHANLNALYLRYLVLPAIFLTVALLGGLRIANDGAFVFFRPALVCLIFAAILSVLFARSGVLRLEGWFSESFTPLKNAANGFAIATLFAAAVQIFNSLLPEQGLTFWIVAFCFFWTLWNNLFADFDPRKLFRSLGGLFGLAFVAKYLILANLTAPGGKTWFEALTENPGQEAITRLLDLPRYAGSTGYIQFFAVGLFLLGLYLFPATTNDRN